MKMNNAFAVLAIAFLALGVRAGAAHTQPFVVATRGRAAECQIVLRTAATDCERYAAKEFATFDAQQTGVTLPVVSEPNGDRPPLRAG